MTRHAGTRSLHRSIRPRGRFSRGFTLVELLVVIGIISLLISILLPSLSKARQQANTIKCRAQLYDIGRQMLMYANTYKGWLFPPDEGANEEQAERWPVIVIEPNQWNTRMLHCPADVDIPADEHSYILNSHLVFKKIKYGHTHFNGRSVSEVVVIGEKKSKEVDYYMDPPDDFPRVVELLRHGPSLGSNYLHLDLSVSNDQPKLILNAKDPWDPVPF